MVGGGDHSRRNAEQLGGSGGSRGASRGGEIRRESVRVSAMLAVSGPQLGVRRPEQSAEKASACAAVVQVQCARVRAFLLM